MSGSRICIVAYKDLTLNTRVARMARALSDAGHTVVLISFAAPDPVLTEGASNIRVIETGVPPLPKIPSAIRWYLGWSLVRRLAGDIPARAFAWFLTALGKSRAHGFANRALDALSPQDTFDVVIAHHEKALIAASQVRDRHGGRLIFDAVEWPFDLEVLPDGAVLRGLRLAEISVERRLLKRADGVVGVNQSLVDQCTALGAPAGAVVRNCRYYEAPMRDGRLRDMLGLGVDDVVVLYLNSIRQGEGIEQAIRALPHTPDHIHLVLLGPVGRGDLSGQLRSQADDAGVGHRVHILPLQTASALIAFAAGADIGIIPRQGGARNMRVSLPNRVFEMVMARLPIAAGRLPEISALVNQHAIGEVFDETDPEDIARVLTSMATPERLATLRDHVSQAAQVLTWEKESEVLLDYLARLSEAKE